MCELFDICMEKITVLIRFLEELCELYDFYVKILYIISSSRASFLSISRVVFPENTPYTMGYTKMVRNKT